eukprot:5941497-Amphidinium_carterae.1
MGLVIPTPMLRGSNAFRSSGMCALADALGGRGTGGSDTIDVGSAKAVALAGTPAARDAALDTVSCALLTASTMLGVSIAFAVIVLALSLSAVAQSASDNKGGLLEPKRHLCLEMATFRSSHYIVM